jgi:hypothetical protein
MVLGLTCSTDPQSCTDSSVATDRASHASQIDGEKPEEQATHWSSRIAGGWM